MNMLMKSCWPTYDQKLLLQAVILEEEKALNAWKEWTTLVDFDNIDYGSQRLIPLLYSNLSKLEIHDPIMKRYKGIYRKFWAKNHLLFHSAEPVLATLQEAGIETLLFKGSGLILTHNFDIALRPMDDIDLLVHPEDVEKAVKIIEQLGWQSKSETAINVNPTTKDVSFRNSSGQFLDLHLHSLSAVKWGKHEMEYWSRALPSILNGLPVKVMGYTDQLIHTIVHGLYWNQIPPIRWIVDAAILLENQSALLEWDYLIEQSRELHAVLPMLEGLRYLQENMGASVPEYVFQSLEHIPVSPMEKWYYRLSTKRPMPVLTNILLQIIGYLVYRQEEYSFPGFLRYMQYKWELDHLWQVPFDVIRRISRSIATEFSSYRGRI